MEEEKVILVNELDEQIGLMPKMEAHEKAVLHRAFSVFVFNDKNQLMLQQRALSKYHSPGLWTNTCCSHQREMGFVTDLEEKTSFIYKAPFDNGLTEHELDHIMVGYYNDVPNINKEEVEAWKWMSLDEVKVDIELQPELYTAWFKIIFEKFYDFIKH